jgi:hypothetical protein
MLLQHHEMTTYNEVEVMPYAMGGQPAAKYESYTHTHTHTHTYIYIYIYIAKHTE